MSLPVPLFARNPLDRGQCTRLIRLLRDSNYSACCVDEIVDHARLHGTLDELIETGHLNINDLDAASEAFLTDVSYARWLVCRLARTIPAGVDEAELAAYWPGSGS